MFLSQYRSPNTDNFSLSFNLLYLNKGFESLKIETKKMILEKQFKISPQILNSSVQINTNIWI